MNRNSRNGGKKWDSKRVIDDLGKFTIKPLLIVCFGLYSDFVADEVNAKNIHTLCDYLLHEFVRCHVDDLQNRLHVVKEWCCVLWLCESFWEKLLVLGIVLPLYRGIL